MSSASTSSRAATGNNSSIKEKKVNVQQELGSHEHTQLTWLKPANIKDKNGYGIDHPKYNSRSLYVPPSFLKCKHAQYMCFIIVTAGMIVCMHACMFTYIYSIVFNSMMHYEFPYNNN